MTTAELVKVAVIREPGHPVGQPAPLYLNCRCGGKPRTVPNGPNVKCWRCKVLYSSDGYIIAKPSRLPCRTCQHEDGSLNTEYLDENGACVFGCGAKIDNDMKMCGTCRDHSANAVECETCGAQYEQWGNDNAWERSA